MNEAWGTFFNDAFTELQVELGDCQMQASAIIDWLYDYACEM